MTDSTLRSPSGTAVGVSAPRVDARTKVTGRIVHVGDMPVGRCGHVAVHRSTRPHARISSIDAAEALAVEGVLAVVTGADLFDVLGNRMITGPAFADQPALAIDRVRYVGEPVAAVVAQNIRAARRAADLVFVEYDELEPVVTIDDAIAGRSFVHNELRPSAVFGDLRHLKGVTNTNVLYEYNLRRGDVTVSREDETTTVSGDFWSPPVHHVPIELPCTVVWPRGDDGIEVLTTTQTPSYVRQAVADMLDLSLHRVRVRTAPLGGAFGSKMYDRLEPLAAALAWTLRMPIRFPVTREEAFMLTADHGAEVIGSMTADRHGRLLAAVADVRYDTGAYADVGPRITGKSGLVAVGPYRVDNVELRSRCMYTNKPSAGPFRGFGVPQVTWFHESIVDEMARELGEDPVEFRRKNLLREGDIAPIGTRMHSADFVGCLDAVADALGWQEPIEHGTGRWRRGRGIAVGMKAVLTPTVANAVVQLNQDGSASLMISTVDMGQGADTIMPQIVAEVLQLAPDAVKTVGVDTDVTPYDTITAGSRSTYHTGNAVRMAAESMHDKILEIAAEMLDTPVTELKLTGDGVFSTTKQQRVSLRDLVHHHFGARGTTLTASANFTTDWIPYDKETGQSEKATEHWFAGAVGVDLRVDTATGRVCVDHLAVAGDVGRAINPFLVRQQLTGAAIMGLGRALFDELIFDHGQMVNGTLLDYQLPSVLDVPKVITPLIIESPHRTGPFGAKGVGETGLIPVAPAVANGVRDATGVRITTLPLTPERVLGALAGKDA